MNALFLIVRSDRDLHSYPNYRVYMHIEKLEEVTLIFSKYQSTLLPIILSGDRLHVRNAGLHKNGSWQKFILFKSRRESMRVHES